MSKVINLYSDNPEDSRKEAEVIRKRWKKEAKAEKKLEKKATFKALGKRKKYCDARGLETKDFDLKSFM